MMQDGSGCRSSCGAGSICETFEDLLAGLDLPPRSPALHQLWRRMLLSSATPPAGAPSADHFLALRLEALYRSGLLATWRRCWPRRGRRAPIMRTVWRATDIGLGPRSETAARTIAALAAPRSESARPAQGRERSCWPATAPQSPATARPPASPPILAREEGIEAELPLARAGGVADGTKPQTRLARARAAARLPLPGAAGPGQRDADLRQGRAGAARRAGGRREERRRGCRSPRPRRRCGSTRCRRKPLRRSIAASRCLAASGGRSGGPAARSVLRRALLFRAVEASRAPAQQARILRAMLDDARRSGIARADARACWRRWLATCRRRPRLGMVRRDQRSRSRCRRASTSGAALGADGCQPAALAGADRRGRSAGGATGACRRWRPIEDLAVRGRLERRRAASAGDRARCARHRRADRRCGMRQAARRSPPPAICPRRACWPIWRNPPSARTPAAPCCWPCARWDPTAPEGANMLALGDAMRALKRVGLEADAAQLGVRGAAARCGRARSATDDGDGATQRSI